ncbi:MAG: hypothetical protein LCH80_14165, partial [Proteobacteria bacterium]|nr:hypothetical protein [Pseudomonadota bacterium]
MPPKALETEKSVGFEAGDAKPDQTSVSASPAVREAVSPPASANGPESQDARALQSRLKRYVDGGEPKPEAGSMAPQPARRSLLTPGVRRAGKVLLGAAVVAVFGLVPLRTLLQTSSVEAVVNARLMTLRSPIAGEVVASTMDLAT